MIKRREFNKIFAGSTLMAASMPVWSELFATEANQIHHPLHFIYETKSLQYGLKKTPSFQEFEKVHYINGDITSVWYKELHFLWQDKIISTAGLTRESEFFLLKTLAKDYGYSVLHQQQTSSNQLMSWALGPMLQATAR